MLLVFCVTQGCVTDGQTDRQTDRQTKGIVMFILEQYKKSKYSKINIKQCIEIGYSLVGFLTLNGI